MIILYDKYVGEIIVVTVTQAIKCIGYDTIHRYVYCGETTMEVYNG